MTSMPTACPVLLPEAWATANGFPIQVHDLPKADLTDLYLDEELPPPGVTKPSAS